MIQRPRRKQPFSSGGVHRLWADCEDFPVLYQQLYFCVPIACVVDLILDFACSIMYRWIDYDICWVWNSYVQFELHYNTYKWVLEGAFLCPNPNIAHSFYLTLYPSLLSTLISHDRTASMIVQKYFASQETSKTIIQFSNAAGKADVVRKAFWELWDLLCKHFIKL